MYKIIHKNVTVKFIDVMTFTPALLIQRMLSTGTSGLQGQVLVRQKTYAASGPQPVCSQVYCALK